MKRPFAAIGFTGFSVLLMLFLCESSQGAYYAFFAFTASGVLSLFNKNLRQAMTVPVCLFTCAAACLLFVWADTYTKMAQSLAGEGVRVEAVVSEDAWMKNDNGRHYCVLYVKSVDGKEAKGKLRLSFSPSKDGIDPEELGIGSTVSFTGKVYIPGEDDKSISRYFTGENIVLGAYRAKDVKIEAADTVSISNIFSKIRQLVSDKLRYGFGDRIAGLIVGILTGDKSCLDDSLYESFKKTGIAHLMAVSGLHLSLWVFSLGAIIPESRKTSKLKYILLALAVGFIMLLAGMSESVKRAGFMTLVYLLGKLSKRRSDGINSLGFAVTVMMLYNPACVLSLSLQLSFLSTLGILILGQKFIKMSAAFFGGKRINRPVRKVMRSCADVFFISISVLVFTFPVLIYAFNGVSTVSAWVNMLISPAVVPLLLMSGAYVIFSGVSFIAFPVAAAIKIFSSYIIFVAQSFMKIKNAFLVFNSENLLLFLAGAVIVGYLCLIAFKGKYRTLTATALCLAASAGLIFTNNTLITEKSVLYMVSYGDEAAVAVEWDKEAVLLNSVPEYEKGLFTSYLEEKGIRLSRFVEDTGPLMLKSLIDGKYISSGRGIELFDNISLKYDLKGQHLKLQEKDIHIFYSEALQCDCNCDIIIRILDNDVTLSAGEKSFSLTKEKNITLTLAVNKMILRGKNPWLNLMKSS